MSRRDLNQWFFRITKYADELLDHSKIDWPDKIATMQKNWIGRSEGVEIEFDISLSTAWKRAFLGRLRPESTRYSASRSSCSPPNIHLSRA